MLFRMISFGSQIWEDMKCELLGVHIVFPITCGGVEKVRFTSLGQSLFCFRPCILIFDHLLLLSIAMAMTDI